ncbi:MAG TPA: beta-propeller fold lactonase family protein [Terriglobia bacterium]|nr:beta-propeller fold lactonase family protein [Terriglobia bacterium]
MSQWKRQTLFAASLAVLGVFVLGPVGANRIIQAQNTTSLNLVYVNGDIASTNMNAVYGYSNDGKGNLTALPGSPYLTDGAGVGVGGGSDHQWDADQEIAVNPEATLLFAVNPGSNTVASFSINTDGSLVPAAGSPVASGGQEPISLAFKDNAFGAGSSLMVVVNKDSDPNQSGGVPNYTTFSVDSAGTMTEKTGSTYNLPAGSSPGQAMMLPGENKFFGLEFLNATISTYSVSTKGLLTQVATTTPPSSPPYVVGGVLDPKYKSTMYVGLPAANQVLAYSFNPKGVLTFVKSVADMGQAVCWLTTNAAGTRLYSAETASGTLTVWSIGTPSNPTQLQHLTLAAVNGAAALPTSMAFDTTGHFLYVVDRNGAIHVLNVAASGTVTEPRAPSIMAGLPSGSVPLGVTAFAK